MYLHICRDAGHNERSIYKIVNDLPNGKSSGFDGVNSESLKDADPLVCL